MMVGWSGVRAFLAHPARIAVLVQGPLPHLFARRVTSGTSRGIRHPSYLGYLFRNLGTVLVFRSTIGLALFLGHAAFIHYRIVSEERLLLEHFGDECRSYIAHTKRLLPLVY